MDRKAVVIFISGSGSNMEMLIKASHAEDYPARIIAVISDKHNAGGLEKAEKYDIPTYVFERKSYHDKQHHEQAILDCLKLLSSDIICLAGYMRLISADFIKPYAGRILNIHPSLLPLFPGLDTHQRAINAGMKIAGCSVHIVTEGMDEGPILAQAVVPLLIEDTKETLAARVLKAEHKLYPQALKNFIQKPDTPTFDGQILFSF